MGVRRHFEDVQRVGLLLAGDGENLTQDTEKVTNVKRTLTRVGHSAETE